MVIRRSHEGVGSFLQHPPWASNFDLLRLFHWNDEIANTLLNNDHLSSRPLCALHLGLRHEGDRSIFNNWSAACSSYGVETWWDGVALASALLHYIQVHLGLDVAVQVVHAFEFDTT